MTPRPSAALAGLPWGLWALVNKRHRHNLQGEDVAEISDAAMMFGAPWSSTSRARCTVRRLTCKSSAASCCSNPQICAFELFG
jgi:hypothetical protein